MSNVNLGSISNTLFNMFDDIPTSISGATLLYLIDQERVYMESILNLSEGTIGSTAIIDKYQPALVALSAATLLRNMQLQGVDVSSIHLGDFSEGKGGGSNVSVGVDFFKEDAQRKLDALRMQNFHMFKANG